MAAVPPEVHALLRVQHGHVSTDQLRDHLTSNQIQHLVRRGDLIDAGRRVYRSPSVGIDELGRCAALCLGRPGLTIAGPTAGRLWGLRRTKRDHRLHVLLQPHANSVSSATFSDRTAIVARRTKFLRDCDVIVRSDAIRVTSRARTCLDLAAMLPPDDVLSVIEQAMHDGGLTVSEMFESVAHLPIRQRGRAQLLEQLGRRLRGRPAESHGEVRLGVALARRIAGLERQHQITLPNGSRIRFDLAVPAIRWAVELDLFPTHRSTVGRESDQRRDVAASALGWVVRRVPDDRFDVEFDQVVEELVMDARRRSRDLAA